MKYWTIRIAEPSPFGDTSLRAIVRAISSADFVNMPGGGAVETVSTLLTQRFELRAFAIQSTRYLRSSNLGPAGAFCSMRDTSHSSASLPSDTLPSTADA
jgi:hypothetical protein